MKRFIGREAELQILQNQMDKPTASFIVVRGRRRIGKSTLIKHFAKPHTFYAFEGLPPSSGTTAQQQRDEFSRQLSDQTRLPSITADDWIKLFQLLWEKSKTGPIVILLDEISWMGSQDSAFLGKIKMAWDNYFSNNPQLMLIVCGSASSWIEKNILSSTGFVGRISYTLTLEELPLQVLRQFWDSSHISGYEILKVLSITGGVPKYLEEINPKLSAEKNIQKTCFTKGGFFVDEFNRIFSDLFLRDSQLYKTIVTILANGPRTMGEIADLADFSKSGRLSDYLNELELSGFVHKDVVWNFKTGHKKKTALYRLKDNYVRFYIKYIEPNRHKIERNNFLLSSLSILQNWSSVFGLQFENLVLHNRLAIYNQLGLATHDIECDGPYVQMQTLTAPGCQIDYLIQDRFHTLYVCEIKFSQNPVSTSVINDMKVKIKNLKIQKHMSVRPVLIHANEITHDVSSSQYFYRIIDFSKLI